MTMELGALRSMTLLAPMLLAWALAHANAQAGATPPTPELSEARQSAEPDASQTSLAHPPTTDEICRALELAAAENALPVEFFARVIWQESRFNASAVSSKGAEGIAQFMPRRPIGMDSRTRSIRLRRCVTRRVISANCGTGLATSDSPRQPTMPVRGE